MKLGLGELAALLAIVLTLALSFGIIAFELVTK